MGWIAIGMKGRILKFLVSGTLAAFVEYVVFYTLVTLLYPNVIIIANIVSFLCGLLLSFTMNKVWVFNSKSIIKDVFFRYFAVAMINLVLGTLLIGFLVNSIGILPLISKVLVMLLIAANNFLIFSRFIFNK